jgi:hypothetical protein
MDWVRKLTAPKKSLLRYSSRILKLRKYAFSGNTMIRIISSVKRVFKTTDDIWLRQERRSPIIDDPDWC